MNLNITQTETALLTSPVKAQFVAPDGRLWHVANGVWAVESGVAQADTLSAEIPVSGKSCRFTVAVPAAMRAAGNPRFVALHLYNAGATAAVAFAAIADLTTGMLFDPFFAAIHPDAGAVLGQTLA